MSLTSRITLTVCALLAVCGGAAGFALHRALRASAEAELRGKVDARLAWLKGVVEVELDDGELQLESRDEPASAAEHWSVATADGKRLWQSAVGVPPGALAATRQLSFGAATDPIAGGDEVLVDDKGDPSKGRPTWAKVAVADVPAAAVESARKSVAGLRPVDAWRSTRSKKKEPNAPAVYELRGTAGSREYHLRVDAMGVVSRVKGHEASPFVDYALPEGPRRLELVLTAATSTAETERQLGRAARVLWTVGPAVLLLTGGSLALLIRWQLRPLRRVAAEAASIGPASAGKRISATDGSAEVAQLRESINAMLARLGEALERERHFASTAAHELRTPLAQMRMTLDVALRRPRESAEYEEALREVSADVERLQRLVVGLLQLTRGPEAHRGAGRPLPVAELLRSVRAGHVQDGEGAWVEGEPELMRSAIHNVIENAERHAPGTGPEVRVEREDGRVRIVVADRGPGVPEAERERIFQPLARLSHTGEGFGLGLAIARATARAFGGELSCRARRDGASGAEFVFDFPAARPAKD